MAIVKDQIARLGRVAPKHERAIVALAKKLQAELALRLKRLAPGKFSTQQTRTLLASIRVIVDELGGQHGVKMGNALQSLGEVAAKIGRDGLGEQIDAWHAIHPGGVARPNLQLASDLLDTGLLEYYQVSRETYGMDMISKMRSSAVRGSLANETLAQTWERMAGEVALPSWKAERIVRTEQSFAMHRRQDLDLHEMFPGAQLGEWRKELVATLDGRTGQDSVFVNHQTRKIDEPFEDNEGRIYQHPPNRPNDREVVVYVPAKAASKPQI